MRRINLQSKNLKVTTCSKSIQKSHPLSLILFSKQHHLTNLLSPQLINYALAMEEEEGLLDQSSIHTWLAYSPLVMTSYSSMSGLEPLLEAGLSSGFCQADAAAGAIATGMQARERKEGK